MDSLENNWKTPNGNAKIFQHEPEQVVGGASVYFASEEEAIGVEYLLAEPEYDDIIDTLLGFNTCTFSVPESYFKEFSALESVLIKRDHVQRDLNEDDKTREKFLDGLSNGYDENHFSISCEDYLLDVELEEETPTLHDVTRDISSVGNVNSENRLLDSDGRNGIHVLKLSDASTSSDHDAMLLDKFDGMSTDKLLEVFRKMFGHQTEELLDIELEEETSILHNVTRDISCIGDVNLENHLANSDRRNCGFPVLKLSDASTSSDHDAMLLDKFDDMSTDKLLEAFRKMFGHQTSVADKQELVEESPALLDVTRYISCIGNVNLENQLADLGGRNCGIHVLKLSDASTSSNHDSVPLDKLDDMSTDKLLEVFTKMFGHQISVADKQWLQPHRTFGLQNQEMSDKNFSFPKFSLDSSENLLTASTAFASIFNFRRKPRVQHVKRREHIQWNSFKWDSKESAEENVKCDGTKSGISERYLKSKPSRGGFGRRYYHRGVKVSSQGLGKRNSQVGCVQIPPGLPIEDWPLAQGSSGTLSDQSSDNTSEDDWTIWTDTRGTNQYRKHKYWSTPEVVKLVEGVSKYGVGRWSDIRRMFFQSSVHRSPADLKDKWRNLLRKSSRRLQSQRGVDAKKKHGVRSIPHDVLNRVRELAVIYPYSRQCRSRISPTASVASSSNVESDHQCFSMNEHNVTFLSSNPSEFYQETGFH
ncbi:uncharacterized protein LOC132045252 isoform X2 [Lycium ferocissimum]|uniref:uncharacterized protein LOC132045252 isoform X2 n=1 Tax=Lycium ferocissimum TaxID=112874 RepID=UPI0028152389|nr:uncharacterized protein LOC132045252 isoform X2 [Lycium ferocissimum]